MPHEHNQDYAKPVVTPFGQVGVTQAGVTIKPFKSLRDALAPPADSSVLEMEDGSLLSLRRRLRGR